MPGRGNFHRMFLFSLHWEGGLALGATPVPRGPPQKPVRVSMPTATMMSTSTTTRR